MCADGVRTPAHVWLLPRNAPCPCRRCLPAEPPPFPRCREGAGGGWRAAGRGARVPEEAPRRSPQRRPVLAAPGPCDPGHIWDVSPAPRRPGAESCGCAACAGQRPRPPPRFKGQAGPTCGQSPAFVSRGDEGERGTDGGRGQWGKGAGGQCSLATNGYGGPGPACSGEAGEGHQDWSSVRRGPQEGFNGSHRAFFSTEVPHTHLLHRGGRQKGFPGPPSDPSSREPPASAGGDRSPRRLALPNPERHSIRDQIRQVVTHLEDVLGGLKQVHVEMKEVVEQIDRLTANIDLGDGGTVITHAGPAAANVPCRPGSRLEGASEPSPTAAVVQLSRRPDEEHVMLRTNSPSPVHMASVVKTNRIGPSRDGARERPGVNGHPSPPYPRRASSHTGRSRLEPPAVTNEHHTPGSRTHKPPPYPQNGRCGNGPCPPTNTLKTPVHPGRRRQSTSMV